MVEIVDFIQQVKITQRVRSKIKNKRLKKSIRNKHYPLNKFACFIYYSRNRGTRTLKGNKEQTELAEVRHFLIKRDLFVAPVIIKLL